MLVRCAPLLAGLISFFLLLNRFTNTPRGPRLFFLWAAAARAAPAAAAWAACAEPGRSLLSADAEASDSAAVNETAYPTPLSPAVEDDNNRAVAVSAAAGTGAPAQRVHLRPRPLLWPLPASLLWEGVASDSDGGSNPELSPAASASEGEEGGLGARGEGDEAEALPLPGAAPPLAARGGARGGGGGGP